jgi:delta 1-pyrroline-5-carboxylate dehydrogenase
VLAAKAVPLFVRSIEAMRARDGLDDARVLLADRLDPGNIDAVLLDLAPDAARHVRAELAAAPGPIIPVVVPRGDGTYDASRLVVERTVTINTAAAGGNAALLALSEDEA